MENGRLAHERPLSRCRGVLLAEVETVTVLMSGGIDSSAVVATLRGTCPILNGVFVDYGQAAANSEWDAVQSIAGHFGISVYRLELGFPLEVQRGEYFVRNALLVLIAAGCTRDRPLKIALGIHALSEYFDSTPLFLRQMQRLLDGYFGGTVTLTAPFLSETKSEVIRYGKDNGVPLELTYSCETQNRPACGRCPSCRERIVANV